PFRLPPPSWSLADLQLTRQATEDLESLVLSREEVVKLCELAHIDLATESGDKNGLDVASVQRDVSAMLRCMRTMKNARSMNNGSEGDGELGSDWGPWGNTIDWAAPLREDKVTDGDMANEITQGATGAVGGYFTAPKVVGGEEEDGL
ncbi:unnamed protein product, partial [Choristocarpus tenellus]